MSQDFLYTFFENSGGKILLKYRKNGKSYSKAIDFYQPSLYMPCDESVADAHTLMGAPVQRKKFENIRAAREFTKRYSEVGGMEWYGNSDYAGQFIIEVYKGETPTFNPQDIRIGILDIEVHTKTFPDPVKAERPINGITIYDTFTDTYYCMGNSEYVREYREENNIAHTKMYEHDTSDEDVGDIKVVYTEFEDEEQLLRAMLQHFKEFNYDLTSGWNSEGFDMVYIVRRCEQFFGEDYVKSMLSPFNRVSTRTFMSKYGEETKVDICGLPHLDYMLLYKKFILKPRDSYKLGNIGEVELGDKKLDYEEEGSLYNLHLQNPDKFFKYNIKDVKLIKRLNDKLRLFELAMTIAYYCACNYEETLKTVGPWESIIAKRLYNNNQVPPFSVPRKEKQEFDGAFVKPVIPGVYNWSVAWDFNSLYPHIEMQCNIGTETFIPRSELPPELRKLRETYTVDDIVEKRIDLSILKKYNYSMTGNFQFYRKDKRSVIAEIKDDMYNTRTEFKGDMKKAKKQKEKVKEELAKRGIKV